MSYVLEKVLLTRTIWRATTFLSSQNDCCRKHNLSEKGRTISGKNKYYENMKTTADDK
jgi:hypothetical protein